MAKDNCVSLSVLELIEEVLIDFIVNNVDDCHRFPDLLNDDDLMKPRPTC